MTSESPIRTMSVATRVKFLSRQPEAAGQDARVRELADGFFSLSEACAELRKTMPAAAAPTAPTVASPALPAAPHSSTVAAARREGAAEGSKAGAAAERARCAKIITSLVAVGRYPLARHLALETNMTADQALSALNAAPVEAVPAAPTGTVRKLPPFMTAAPQPPPAPSALTEFEQGANEAKRLLRRA